MRYFLPLIVLALFPLRVPTAEPAFTLDREDLVVSDTTLVIRLHITTSAIPEPELTRLTFRWRDESSMNISNGINRETEKVRRADVLLIAQVAKGTDKHPPMLLLSTVQESQGKAHTSQTHALDRDMALSDAITITVEPGTYPLTTPLRIGTLGSDPILFQVGPYDPEHVTSASTQRP